MPNLPKIDRQLPQEGARRSHLDLVLLPLHLHGPLLLHPLLRGLVPGYRAGLRGLPVREGQAGGQMLLTVMTIPLYPIN